MKRLWAYLTLWAGLPRLLAEVDARQRSMVSFQLEYVDKMRAALERIEALLAVQPAENVELAQIKASVADLLPRLEQMEAKIEKQPKTAEVRRPLPPVEDYDAVQFEALKALEFESTQKTRR